MNGIELLNRIREDRNLRDMPVVMVTAQANRELVAEGAESDIDAYILKPLTATDLASRILKVIEKANNPPLMTYHLKRARDFEETGDLNAAIKEAELAREADSSSSRPVRELGHLYFKKNSLKKAEKWLRKATEMNEFDVFALHYLGELYLKQNDIDKASLYFDKAMSINPRHITRGINFGKILVQKNMIEKAVKVFDKAIGLSDNSLPLSEEIADFCLQNRIYEYAIELLEFISNRMATRYDVIFKLGTAYESLNQPSKALSYYHRADEMAKTDIHIKLHIAKKYIDLKQVIRAEQMLNSILKLDPKHKEAQKLLRQVT